MTDNRLSRRLYYQDSPVGVLVDSLQVMAARRGLTLGRWETRAGGLVERVVYAVHAGEEEQVWEEQEQVVAYVTLRKMEGASAVCEAYFKLNKLKIKLEKIFGR